MTVKVNTLLIILGALVLGGGLILGLSPVSQSGYDCGSAFSPSNGGLVADYSRALGGYGQSNISGKCDDALSSRRGIALALTIPGALLAGAGVVLTLAGTKKAAEHVVGTEATPSV